MWWGPQQVLVTFDSSAQATLDRLTSTMALLTETIARTGKTMSALTDAAKTLVDEVAEIIADAHADQATIADLTAKLAAALAANDPTEANAVTAQLTQAAADLKVTLDALHPPVDATPAPAPAPSA